MHEKPICGRYAEGTWPVGLFHHRKKQVAANFTDWMKHRVDSAKGKEIYIHRMSVVEPVFGNIGSNNDLIDLVCEVKRKSRLSGNCIV